MYGHLSRLKEPLQGIPYMLTVPAKAALVRAAITVIQLPWGYLVAASLIVRVQHGVLLQYLYDIPPVYPIKVVTNSASDVVQPGAPWKRSFTFSNFHGEDDLIYLEEVFMLAYW